MRSIASMAAALCAAAGMGAAGPVDFEDVTEVGFVTTLDSGGFNFASDYFHSLNSTGGIADNASEIYIGHEGGHLGRAITMTKIGGGVFDVWGLDGAELWITDDPQFPNASQIRVTGFFQAGGSITHYLPLDGIIDGTGGVNDFQSFTLTGFTNLIAFQMNGVDGSGNENFAFAVDDITLESQLVPLPSASALAGLGLLGLGSRRRRSSL